MTLSPGVTEVTSLPTSSIVPAASWPRITEVVLHRQGPAWIGHCDKFRNEIL